MWEVGNRMIMSAARSRNGIPLPFPTETNSRSSSSSYHLRASLKKNEFSPKSKKGNRTPRRLIKLSTAEGKWPGKWKSDYIFSLRELHLEDLEEDGDGKAQVSISLSVEKHASFGLSVDGNISSSITRKCISCANPYCREIDTNFHVWVLQSSRDSKSTLPEIGGDDPAVIYVKPGCEADIDALVRETVRLTTSINEACSELCEKSEPMTLDLSKKDDQPLFDRRWSKLLELRKSYL